jgi:hypothetical protein
VTQLSPKKSSRSNCAVGFSEDGKWAEENKPIKICRKNKGIMLLLNGTKVPAYLL